MDSFGGGGGYMQDGGGFASPMGESQEKKVCILIIVVGNSSLYHNFQGYKIPLLDGKQLKTFIITIIPRFSNVITMALLVSLTKHK